MSTPTIDRRIKLDEPTKPESNLIDLADISLASVSDKHRLQLQRIQGWCAFFRSEQTPA